MRQIAADLWVTEAQNPAPGLYTHAYLWTRPEGNVLFYNTTLPEELDRIAELGGAAHQYLSHQDEITSTLADLADRFGTRLHIHASEASLVTTTPVHDPFTDRHTGVGGVEVIPTPGHTPGSTSYLAQISGRRYLFTGDTILRGEKGDWWAGYLEGYSDRESLLATLDVLDDLTPEVILSSAVMDGSDFTELGDRPWAAAVDEARQALLTGSAFTP
ncbi:MBL fold metallo-hydrolase [Nocardia sp. 2]|uniref:MBL fold metallo-hydrolase n=1 Tax=Nocardia acididurans TaxID=2802282 RepID=A0ABS1MFG5_9NOCA|nr:MBL fold metallo-hydrolase [Nocardia acididurans]MBL1079393.1 MBL fold metallo-hydrolase [Nocardia acididurans]